MLIEAAERSAQQLPHREKYLLIVTGFMRRYLELHLELIDRVEKELEDESETKSAALPEPGAADRL